MFFILFVAIRYEKSIIKKNIRDERKRSEKEVIFAVRVKPNEARKKNDITKFSAKTIKNKADKILNQTLLKICFTGIFLHIMYAYDYMQ